MRVFSGLCIRTPSVLIVVVFLCSCSSRQWVTPGNYELDVDDSVYRAVTIAGDTITFAGNSVNDEEQNFITGDPIYRFDGNGGVFSDGEIYGFLRDGREVSVKLIDASRLEIDKYNSGKTILFTAGILVATVAVFYVLINGHTSPEAMRPVCD